MLRLIKAPEPLSVQMSLLHRHTRLEKVDLLMVAWDDGTCLVLGFSLALLAGSKGLVFLLQL